MAAPIFKKITQYILYKKKDFAQFARYDEKSNKVNLDEVHNTQASVTKSFAPGYMPNFVGMDKQSALLLAEERNLQLSTNGFGVVKTQSIPAGTVLSGVTNIKLTFEAPTYVE